MNGGYYHAPKSGDPPDGVLFLYGKGVKRTRITGASLFDVAPTILYAMGLAAGPRHGRRRAEGRVRRRGAEAPPGGRSSRPTSGTARPAPGAGTGAGTEVDDKVMEDLRALGYVQGTGKAPTAAPDGDR